MPNRDRKRTLDEVELDDWSHDVLKESPDSVTILKNWMLGTRYDFLCQEFPDHNVQINFNDMIEGSLNRNFRQYGQLKSRVE